MRMHVFTALCIALVVGCDMENGDCDVNPEMRQEENVDLNRDGVADLNGRGREAITITDVVLHESEGGYYTDNRFICNVRSREDCELALLRISQFSNHAVPGPKMKSVVPSI